jgi:rhamnogalacturonan endolyase
MRPLLLALTLLLAHTAAAQLAPPVTITDQADHVTLANGIVTFAITKANGNISALRYHSTNILAEPGYLDWVAGGNHHIAGGKFTIITSPASNNGALAELSITSPFDPHQPGSPIDVDLHYILRQGDPGPYCFVILHHAPSYPAGGVGQCRWVLRLDDSVFDTINIDDQRRFLMPPANTPVKILGPKESMMFTSGPFAGQITDKYHFFADAGDHFVHGWTGSRTHLGCFILYGSNEAQNGGPTKQHNTAHWGRMLFKIVTCGHYGSGSGLSFAAGEEWSKIYGPWMLYLNTGASTDTLWADAKAQAARQRAQWPPAWMTNPLFPPASARATVTGRLLITDPQDPAASPAGAWVGLALPQPDWQKQGKAYQFWVHARPDGSFAIPAVRPGTYTLYAFTPGVMDQFRRDDILVKPGTPLALGTLTWTPLRFGQQLWQIGTPDRSAAEFRHGDNYRQWGLWQKFPTDFPHGVNYIIGQSHPATDWNYAHVNILQNGQWIGTTWNILFDTPQPPPSGLATLRIALAAAHNAKLTITVNSHPVASFRTPADNALIRAGIHGQYAEHDIPFPSSLLIPGRNTISLTQSAAGNAQKSVMYDCLRLELDPTHPFNPSINHPTTTPDDTPTGSPGNED